MSTKTQKIIRVVIPIILGLISMFVLAGILSSPDFHKNTIATLNEKRTTVMELTAASTAGSAAITLIPGDTATPIADKLADLSSYFIVVLCAIYLEKYLVTIIGYVTFGILIPLACALYAVNVFANREAIAQLVKKLVMFGLAIFLVVPVSVKISNIIDATYQESMQETLESAQETIDEIESSEDEGGISGFISGITDGLTVATTKVKTILNNFIDAIAVMIVTSCIIPILVIMFFVKIINAVLGMNINISDPIKIRHSKSGLE